MAKQPITLPSYSVNNIQQLPDVVKNQAVSLKVTYDKTGADTKNYLINTLIAELNGSNGASKIGVFSTEFGADNVLDALVEILDVAKQAQAGTILPNSITNSMLATDVKVGSLSALLTIDTSSVVNAINELKTQMDTNTDNIETNSINLDILRIAKTDTGVADAYVVDTAGTFSRVDGNTLTFIPSNTNTGASTMNEDGNGVAAIEYYDIGTASHLPVEAEMLKKFNLAVLTWNASRSAFQLAPKGSNVLKGQLNATMTSNVSLSTQTMTLRTTVNGSGWVLAIPKRIDVTDYVALKIDGVYVIGNATQGRTYTGSTSSHLPYLIRFETSFEFYNNTNNTGIIYVLGGDLSKYVNLNQFGLTAVAPALTTVLDISGKGWFNGITNMNSVVYSIGIKLTVDGIIQFAGNTIDLGNLITRTRFETSLKIETEAITNLDFLYALD